MVTRVEKGLGFAKAPQKELGSSHITPAGGNVFADLGFAPDEAARLKAASTQAIAAQISGAISGHPAGHQHEETTVAECRPNAEDAAAYMK